MSAIMLVAENLHPGSYDTIALLGLSDGYGPFLGLIPTAMLYYTIPLDKNHSSHASLQAASTRLLTAISFVSLLHKTKGQNCFVYSLVVLNMDRMHPQIFNLNPINAFTRTL